MKKKFVLTSALVLIVVASLVAATPIEVSGTFETGYTFGFNPTSLSHDHETELSIGATFTGDFWKVSLNGTPFLVQYGDDDTVSAKAEIYLSKALEAEGVDMGDVSVTLFAGEGVAQGGKSVFANKGKVKDIGVAMGTADNFGVSLGYGSLVEVYLATYPGSGFPMIVGAKVTPVDGVSVAGSFTNDANALNASVAADIAKLADLDFALSVTAGYKTDLNKAHDIGVDVAGKIEDIGFFVAYGTDLTAHKVIANANAFDVDLTVTFDNDGASKNGLKVAAGYKTTVEGIGLSAGVTVANANLGTDDFGVELEAGATYSLGGVDYALDLGYEIGGAFTVSPSLSISF